MIIIVLIFFCFLELSHKVEFFNWIGKSSDLATGLLMYLLERICFKTLLIKSKTEFATFCEKNIANSFQTVFSSLSQSFVLDHTTAGR